MGNRQWCSNGDRQPREEVPIVIQVRDGGGSNQGGGGHGGGEKWSDSGVGRSGQILDSF